ncbi:MAG: DNA mismatch repair endonuclease MutL [Eubacteriales bacterium]|nr:DNA mismatch repair endonuclease MutL [Eubacteriales bacterium]
MKVINILPPVIYNRLAAGEVVENPASIVKELLENSLDANAKQITVQIVNGGIDEIVVVDDGDGVAESELPKVFMPHATSKIARAEDIDNITSLGFRGEALASISSVAKVTFTSKPDNQDYAVSIDQDNAQQYTSGNRGTTVRVTNLFYNTPARKKFLRSANVEKNHVTQIIHEIIFAHPDLQLRYYVDNRLVLDYRAQGLSAAMQMIFSIDASHLVAIDDKKDGISVQGYVSDLSLSKINKDRQVVIVNGRVVNGGVIASVVNETMSHYLPMREYSVFVLDFTVATDRVDVNVHPQKREVRFDDRDMIIGFVRGIIARTMEEFFLKQVSQITQTSAPTPTQSQPVANNQVSNAPYIASVNPSTAAPVAPQPTPAVGHSFNPAQTEAATVMIKSLDVLGKNNLVESAPNILNHMEFNQTLTATQTNVLPTNLFTILGQVFETYLLVRTADSLLIIDQHAMAERINYDKFCAEVNNHAVQSQMLLTPLIIAVTPKEMTRFMELKPLLANFGFECDEFGADAIRLSAVPAMMIHASLKDFITVLLNDKAVVNDNFSELIQHRVATAACKASIKAGQILSQVQIESFLKNYFTTKNVPLCPHGRPIMLVYSQSKLESLFARK